MILFFFIYCLEILVVDGIPKDFSHVVVENLEMRNDYALLVVLLHILLHTNHL